MVTNKVSPLTVSDVLGSFLSPSSSIPSVLFIVYILLTVVECVAFNYSSITSTPKTLDCILEYLEFYCYKIIIPRS